jgi:nucleoside-diphosphate-sugar epimerase
LLFVSSLAAAGPSPLGRLRVETDPLAPVSIYGGSKLAGERLIAPLAGNLPITIVRPPIVFGYGDENIAEFYRTMRRTGMHLVPGSGSGRFSLIEVHDLVEGIRLAAERGARLETTSLTDGRAQGVYFLGGDEHPTYYELGERIARAIGSKKLRVVRIPEWMAWIAAATSELNSQVVRRPALLNFDKVRELTAGSWACSSQRANAELGFCVARSLDERLAEVAAVYVAADRG